MTSLMNPSIILFILLVFAGVGFVKNSHQGPDVVLYNGLIWDGERDFDITYAIALKGSGVMAVDKADTLLALCKGSCQALDMKGQFIQPGFHDSHAHLVSGGASLSRLKVSGSNITSIQQDLKSYAASKPHLVWILGRGWYAGGFGNKYPTAKDLDAVESERPVILSDTDGHVIWVNSKAMQLAGITRDTKDPVGGTILRDAQGNPTGVFQEGAASLIYDAVPDSTPEEYFEYIRRGQEVGLAAGVTSWTGGGVSSTGLQHFLDFEKKGELKIRTFLWGDLEAETEELEKVLTLAQSIPADSLVKFVGFKGFVDGVISSYTAALLAPYADHHQTTGTPNYTQEELNKLVLRVNEKGYPAFLHAIGDKAVNMSLNAFEVSKKQLNHPLKNRIEHIEVIDPQDVPRFAKLNVVASVQPAHIHWGSLNGNYYIPRLGSPRVKFAFMWNSIVQSGGLITFGSDWPVVGWDPIEGLYCAMEREACDKGAFSPFEVLDPETALKGFTVNPAISIGQGHQLGKLLPGYKADVLVLKNDPRKFKTSSTFNNPPSMMFINGERYFNGK